jgi:hypothetical protein
MDRVRIYAYLEDVPAGDLLKVLGPDAAGALDTGGGVAFATAVGALERGVRGSGRNAHPPRVSPGDRVPARSFLSEPLAFGAKQFQVRTLDGRSGVESAAGDTVTAYVNSEPRHAKRLAGIAALVGGKLRFTFDKSADMA